jgi:hypothetical protein
MNPKGREAMIKHSYSAALVIVSVIFGLFLAVPVRAQQFPIVDDIAGKVVQKYQMMSCEQLWQEKGQPKSDIEQRIVQELRQNPAMRDEFFHRVSVPIVTKMFECGMIP